MSSLDMISQVFPNNFQQIYNYFCSLGMSFILKTCQIVAGASMIHQFPEFLEFYFWRIFVIWSIFGVLCSRKTRAISLIVEPLDLEMGLLAVKDV